jgi:hypothetical protein
MVLTFLMQTANADAVKHETSQLSMRSLCIAPNRFGHFAGLTASLEAVADWRHTAAATGAYA